MPLREESYYDICMLALCHWHKHRSCSNMPTGWVFLQDGCLLDRCHSISMPGDLLPLNSACLLLVRFSICIPAGMMSHCQPCFLVWCLTIGHAFLCGASLSAVPAGVVPHYIHGFWCGASLSAMSVGVGPPYRWCFLVSCLTVGHAFLCDALLLAMPVGVVPFYQQCLLVWCLTIGHAFGVVPQYRPCLLVHCNQYFTGRVQMEEDGYKSGATCTEVP